jgi:hypothetical protein
MVIDYHFGNYAYDGSGVDTRKKGIRKEGEIRVRI